MLTNYKLVDEYYDDEDPVITNKNYKNHTSSKKRWDHQVKVLVKFQK